MEHELEACTFQLFPDTQLTYKITPGRSLPLHVLAVSAIYVCGVIIMHM